MENLAVSLCELVKQATSNSVATKEKDKAASAISLMVDQIPQIKNYISEDLRIYYDEALSYTEADVKRNLHRFIERKRINLVEINCQTVRDREQVKKKFISWTTLILKTDCMDVRRTQTRRIRGNQPAPLNKSLNQEINKDGTQDSKQEILDTLPESNITLSGIEQWLNNNLKNNIEPAIVSYLEKDPDGKLKDCHPRNNPNCNCQALLIRRLIDGEDNINNLAEEFGVSRQTLQDYLSYRKNPTRADAKCFRLLIAEVEEKYQVNLKQYLDGEE